MEQDKDTMAPLTLNPTFRKEETALNEDAAMTTQELGPTSSLAEQAIETIVNQLIQQLYCCRSRGPYCAERKRSMDSLAQMELEKPRRDECSAPTDTNLRDRQRRRIRHHPPRE